MLIIGIDVSKYKHDLCIFNPTTGEVSTQLFSFESNRSGFIEFKELLDGLNEPFIVGLESTGHYHKTLVSFLADIKCDVHILNPIQTNRLRQTQIRVTKTDKIDALIIAQAVNLNLSVPFHFADDVIVEIRQLSRFRYDLVNEITVIKNRLTALFDQTFPEVVTFFKSGIFGVYSSRLLKELPTAKLIASTRIDKLQRLLSKQFNASILKSIAKSSVGIHLQGHIFQIQLLYGQLELLNKQKRTIENHLQELLIHVDCTLTSIPGVSTVLASIIIGEIGSIHLFDSPDKLLAFAGIDPTIYQSGTYEAKSNRMSKRGSKYLRHALMQAAKLLVTNDNNFKSYYTKKKEEGKHHFVALSHCARKLVRVIFKLLKENINYKSFA